MSAPLYIVAALPPAGSAAGDWALALADLLGEDHPVRLVSTGSYRTESILGQWPVLLAADLSANAPDFWSSKRLYIVASDPESGPTLALHAKAPGTLLSLNSGLFGAAMGHQAGYEQLADLVRAADVQGGEALAGGVRRARISRHLPHLLPYPALETDIWTGCLAAPMVDWIKSRSARPPQPATGEAIVVTVGSGDRTQTRQLFDRLSAEKTLTVRWHETGLDDPTHSIKDAAVVLDMSMPSAPAPSALSLLALARSIPVVARAGVWSAPFAASLITPDPHASEGDLVALALMAKAGQVKAAAIPCSPDADLLQSIPQHTVHAPAADPVQSWLSALKARGHAPKPAVSAKPAPVPNGPSQVWIGATLPNPLMPHGHRGAGPVRIADLYTALTLSALTDLKPHMALALAGFQAPVLATGSAEEMAVAQHAGLTCLSVPQLLGRLSPDVSLHTLWDGTTEPDITLHSTESGVWPLALPKPMFDHPAGKRFGHDGTVIWRDASDRRVTCVIPAGGCESVNVTNRLARMALWVYSDTVRARLTAGENTTVKVPPSGLLTLIFEVDTGASTGMERAALTPIRPMLWRTFADLRFDIRRAHLSQTPSGPT